MYASVIVLILFQFTLLLNYESHPLIQHAVRIFEMAERTPTGLREL